MREHEQNFCQTVAVFESWLRLSQVQSKRACVHRNVAPGTPARRTCRQHRVISSSHDGRRAAVKHSRLRPLPPSLATVRPSIKRRLAAQLRETVGKLRPRRCCGACSASWSSVRGGSRTAPTGVQRENPDGNQIPPYARFANRPFCPSCVRRARADFLRHPTQNEK